MICVWWDWEGVVHWEMLERNVTVNKNLYISQLRRVNEAIRLKIPDRQGQVILLYDNARPIARMGSSSIPPVLSRPCANGLSSFPLHVEPNERCYLR